MPIPAYEEIWFSKLDLLLRSSIPVEPALTIPYRIVKSLDVVADEVDTFAANVLT